jgi:uncharacterized membrane protein HdeD (DUF308 family)
MLTFLARNWWLLALRGLLAVVFGVLAFVWPDITLVALVLLFGAYALVDGAFTSFTAIRDREEHEHWKLLLVEGLSGIGAGVLTLLWPGITAFILLYLIAGWALATGLMEIIAAVRLREEIEGEWLFAFSGVLSILLGATLIIRPGAGALGLVWLIGTYAVIFGFTMIVLALKLRREGKLIEMESFA